MKGRIVIGQSGGCTAVINASLAGAVLEARRLCPGCEVLGAVHAIQGILAGEFVSLSRFGEDELLRLARTPASALGSCRYKLVPGDAERAASQLLKVSAGAFIYIGGNDSADTALQVHRAARLRGVGLNVIGVPKTIDNDLVEMDHTPGYASAARYLACAVANSGRDTESMCLDEPVKIIEVSGRNAGWLACAAALGKRSEWDAPQVVWPPEVVFDEDDFLARVEAWRRRLGYCVVVVTETIRDAGGRPVSAARREPPKDAFGHPRLVGAAEFLCDVVRERLGVRARWEKMGTIGRTAAEYASPVDRREARRLGAAAVRSALQGASGQEVVLLRNAGRRYGCRIGLAPLEDIANAEKRVPAGMFDARAMLPTRAFRDYALPLLGPALPEYPRVVRATRLRPALKRVGPVTRRGR